MSCIRLLIRLAAIAACCVLTRPVLACVNPTGDGPTVALVLSGGGALANTQIGAMSVIEELDIPIHCIVGTSMGSVVAAFYAAGYEVDEIRRIFQDSPWPQLMGNVTSRRDLPYLEKERRDEYYSDYIAGITPAGLQLPGGLIGMGNLQFHFRQLLTHVPLDIDFDHDLRMPFRAVAMNLSTGEATAFGRGDLVEAMLASMAVPGVFTPRFINGEVYVDGGLAQNLPVQTALDMGADIVIGIDLTIEPPKMDERVAITDLTLQLNRLTVWKAYKEQLELLSELDVVIQPDIEGLGVGSFELAELGYARGREAVEPHREALLSIRELAAPAADGDIAPGRPPAESQVPRIVNKSKIRDSAIQTRVALDSDIIEDPERLQRRLRDLASFGGFGEVDLAVGRLAPVLTVKERPLGTTLIQAGVRATSNFDGDSNFAALGRVSRRPLLPGGGEFSLSGAFGTDLGVTAELYKPFGTEKRLFLQPTLAYRAEEILFDIEGVRIGEFWQQATTFQTRLGREIGQWGLLSVEGLITDGRIRPQVTIAPEIFPTDNYTLGGVGLRFATDTLDNIGFPHRGTRFTLAVQRLADLEDGDTSNKARLSLITAGTRGRTSVVLRVRGEIIESESNDPVEILSLGGFRRLSAFSPNSLPNDQYLLGVVEVFHRFGSLEQVAALPIYAGVTLEYANVQFEAFDPLLQRNYGSVGAYLGADTVLGPVFLGAGVSDAGRYTFFLNIGRNFR
jgi:NTE family protein